MQIKGKGEFLCGGAPLLGIDAPDADLAVVERRLQRRELPLRAASAVHRRERPDPEPENADSGQPPGRSGEGTVGKGFGRVLGRLFFFSFLPLLPF